MRFSAVIASVALVACGLLSGARAQTCVVDGTTVDPFTQAARNSIRRGSKVKITLKIGNGQVFDMEGLTLQVNLPAGFQFLKSSLTALPDRLTGPKGTKQVKAVATGQTVTWNPFIIPANMTKPRTATVWTRVNKNAPTGSTTIAPATITVNGGSPCTGTGVSSNQVTITIK